MHPVYFKQIAFSWLLTLFNPMIDTTLAGSPLKEADLNAAELWEQFIAGDRVAYQKLYCYFLPGLYSYGFKIIANKEVVNDCLQDLFIDLWKYKDNLSMVYNIKQYLFSSFRNKLIKTVTRNRYQACDMELAFADTLVVFPFEQSIIDNQTQGENKMRLQKAFHCLSKRQQEAINLLFYEKFSYEQVSDIMNINLRSVYTLVWKALSLLRKELLILLIAAFQG